MAVVQLLLLHDLEAEPLSEERCPVERRDRGRARLAARHPALHGRALLRVRHLECPQSIGQIPRLRLDFGGRELLGHGVRRAPRV